MTNLEQWWDAKRDNMQTYLDLKRLSQEEKRSITYLHDWSLNRGWGEPQTTLMKFPGLYDAFRTASLAFCKQLEALTEALSEAGRG